MVSCRIAGLIVRWRNEPSQKRMHRKDVEKVAAHPDAFRIVRFAARRQIERFGSPGRNGGKAFLAFANLLPHGKSDIRIAALEISRAPVAIRDFYDGELFWVLHRNRAQADGVNQLKNCGVGADSQGQRQDCHKGESRAESKHSEAIAKVPPDCGHVRSPPVGVSDVANSKKSRMFW